MSACGGTPREASRPIAAPAPDAAVEAPVEDPELHRPAPPKLLAIDWSTTKLESEGDALALWERIAPTGADWSDKLDEVPGDGDIAVKLALALLRSGNFQCVPARASTCGQGPIDVPEPAPSATLADACLRRLLALWSIVQLDEDTVAQARDALRAIAALPPPESELVAAALKALPDTDQDGRLELLAIAFRAGHGELVNGLVHGFDDAHLTEAVQKHHIDGALDQLSAESHRAVFLAAIADEQLHANARVQAISEVLAATDTPSKDLRAVAIRAAKSPNCTVAAAAARFLVRSGETKFAPAKPRTTKPAVMMRALCVLASYEAGLRPDEPTYLLRYVPKRGLELVTVTYDEYNDVDNDGDGDPHTETTVSLVPRDEVTLPEQEDLVRAFASCRGTTCTSESRDFRFHLKPAGGDLVLHRLEVIERPPCKKSAIPNP